MQPPPKSKASSQRSQRKKGYDFGDVRNGPALRDVIDLALDGHEEGLLGIGPVVLAELLLGDLPELHGRRERLRLGSSSAAAAAGAAPRRSPTRRGTAPPPPPRRWRTPPATAPCTPRSPASASPTAPPPPPPSLAADELLLLLLSPPRVWGFWGWGVFWSFHSFEVSTREEANEAKKYLGFLYTARRWRGRGGDWRVGPGQSGPPVSEGGSLEAMAYWCTSRGSQV